MSYHNKTNDGKIYSAWTEYWIDCMACNNYSDVHAKNKRKAEAMFRKDGWAKRKGKFYCPECISEGRILSIEE